MNQDNLMKSKVLYIIAALFSSFIFIACQYSLALWVMPNSTVDNLVFGFSETRNGSEKVTFSQMMVYPCSVIKKQPEGGYYPSNTFSSWSVISDYQSPPQPSNRVVYGRLEQGMENQREPVPLTAPGCYVVLAYAKDGTSDLRAASTGFKITEDGKIVEMERHEFEKIFSE